MPTEEEADLLQEALEQGFPELTDADIDGYVQTAEPLSDDFVAKSRLLIERGLANRAAQNEDDQIG